MTLVSIQPFAPKKLFALGATIACLSTASCFADAMYLSTRTDTSARTTRETPTAMRTRLNPAKPQTSFAANTNWSAQISELTFGYQAGFQAADAVAATCTR